MPEVPTFATTASFPAAPLPPSRGSLLPYTNNRIACRTCNVRSRSLDGRNWAAVYYSSSASFRPQFILDPKAHTGPRTNPRTPPNGAGGAMFPPEPQLWLWPTTDPQPATSRQNQQMPFFSLPQCLLLRLTSMSLLMLFVRLP